MGTNSQTFIFFNNGNLAELSSIKDSSSTVADANKIISTNDSGRLDTSFVDCSVTSSANKIVKQNPNGQLDLSLMPGGINPTTILAHASEDIESGKFVYLWLNGGVLTASKAIATSTNTLAVGFVLNTVLMGDDATVYWSGINTSVSGCSIQSVFLSDVSPGDWTLTPPINTGSVIQCLGRALSSTIINFEPARPIIIS